MNTFVRSLLGAAVLLTACGGRLDDPDKFRQTPDVVNEILPLRCGTAGCHAADNPAQGLDLVSPGVVGRLNGVASMCDDRPLVAPGGSYIVDKIVFETPACGGRMPPGGQLSEAEITAIRLWVDEVATASTSTTT